MNTKSKPNSWPSSGAPNYATDIIFFWKMKTKERRESRVKCRFVSILSHRTGWKAARDGAWPLDDGRTNQEKGLDGHARVPI